MSERIDLTAPDQSRPGTPLYRVAGLWLDWDGRTFYVVLLGDNDTERQETYRDGQDEMGNDLPGSTIATDRMRALNRANLTNKSLQRRIMEMLISDGRLDGSISGTPD